MATRVRNTRELALFEATLSANAVQQRYSISPSDQMESTGRYLVSGLLSGMKETERRIQLHNAAQRRLKDRTIFQKSMAKPRENERRRMLDERRARHLKMHIRVDEKQVDRWDGDNVEDLEYDKYELDYMDSSYGELRV